MANRRGVVAGLASATLAVVATISLTACGQVPAGQHPMHRKTVFGPGVDTMAPPRAMSAARACRLVVTRAPRGFFAHVERGHLVLTTYAKGQPVESHGD